MTPEATFELSHSGHSTTATRELINRPLTATKEVRGEIPENFTKIVQRVPLLVRFDGNQPAVGVDPRPS